MDERRSNNSRGGSENRFLGAFYWDVFRYGLLAADMQSGVRLDEHQRRPPEPLTNAEYRRQLPYLHAISVTY